MHKFLSLALAMSASIGPSHEEAPVAGFQGALHNPSCATAPWETRFVCYTGETTTTTANDLVNTAVIIPVLLGYAFEKQIVTPHARYFNGIGAKGNVFQVPRITSDMTVNDNGASVDGEFAASEGSTLSNVALDTENAQFTVAGHGLKRTLTDELGEDNVLGPEFLSAVIADAGLVLATSVEYDLLASGSGITAGVGTSTQDATIANFLAAVDTVSDNGWQAPDGLRAALHNEQWKNLRDAFTATGTSWAVHPGSSAALFRLVPDAVNGMRDGHVADVYGVPVDKSGHLKTENTGADVLGFVYTPSTPMNDKHATFAYVEKRPMRVETMRQPDLGSGGEMIVFTRRCAVGKASNSGCRIVTDAP